ncbi:hypothetical protein SPRG_04998 [Saprolegnia parasitica CBS 223.65]|uniref:Acyltransferase 3 domain-containing protein n=1 Tax=Saprolegnia parasitica (strain CBS 223.65) TaxID=695850 RepID=A0A067CUP1_SAPPC|nr:hypothetical protein SPRG_04998 [Saprolegnia parasitica CBS 223.65]KDO30226.1 hypothetical protein SPRG_04998 [Saprolegnia parasitica CBS 223.65]|eukprot:XP_012198902.1 hypothetical protein SPRG_04998 [Saprolegnia parasitica CBS 223.65]
MADIHKRMSIADEPDTEPDDVLLSDHAPSAIEAAHDHAPPAPSHTYRPDIDGLRTLAVVPVLVFHANPKLFPGGFIGVDIFFVISGFLISGILFKEHKRGKFTYASFYERRVRRIFPTLIIVLGATLWLGYLYLMAPKLKLMAATMFAGTLFAANLQVLSLEKAYFDLGANPVLHLWSLGVEEQFYILWPCFCAIIMKLSYKRAIILQVAFMAFSFAINIAFLGFRDNKVSFYMPLCRFWQMSMGGLLSYITSQAAPAFEPLAASGKTPPSSGGWTSAAGLGLILLGFASINEHRAFPGFWALLPTLGATLLIAAGPHAPLNRYILSNAVVVYIGKISYCLYLWHWPILVISGDRYPASAPRPFFAEPWVILLISVALSIATYEDVELRLRRRKSKWITPLLALGVAGLAALSAAVYTNPANFSMIELSLRNVAPPIVHSVGATNATSGNVQASLKQAQAAIYDGNWQKDLSECPKDSPYLMEAVRPDDFQSRDNYFLPGGVFLVNPGHEKDNGLLIVLGDSHSDMTKPRLAQLYENAKAAKNDSTFPTIAINSWSGRPLMPCRAEYYANLAMIKSVKPQAILLVQHYYQYVHPTGPDSLPYEAPPQCCYEDNRQCPEQSIHDVNAMWSMMEKDLKELTDMGIKVFVVDQSPEYEEMNPSTWISGDTVTMPKPMFKSEFNREYKWLLDPLHAMVKNAGATLIDYADNYSLGDEIMITDAQGYPVMCYGLHLNTHFARNYLTVIDQVVDAARLQK